MKRRPLYSRSGKPRTPGESRWLARDGISPVYVDLPLEAQGPALRQRLGTWWNGVYRRHQAIVLVASSAIVTLALMGGYDLTREPAQHLTQTDLNAAVNYAIDHRPPDPAVTATAYATIIPSVVRVDGYDPADATPPDGDPDHVLPPGHPPVPSSHGPASPGTAPDPGKEAATIPNPNGQAPGAQAPNVQAPNGQDPEGQDGGETGKSVYENTAVGSGVVINKDGTILTNLHVAAAASRLRVTFADGTEANASIVGSEPDNDLAIIKPDKVPDDLKPATLASTDGLNPGDEVEAVGFPFGIGPSASAGVVSGLKREFKEEGRGTLRNLIQFDAAANPGNSGGPLVDRDGEVVGIVTGILNPSGVRTFAGIGFAVPIENATSGMGESPL